MRYWYRNFLLITLLFTPMIVFSQGRNMTLLNKFNPANPSLQEWVYSALWGYVAPDNKEYAILGANTGTYFYEIRNDTTSRFVGFVPTGANPGDFGNYWREMKTYSHYAYIVSEADTSGVQIVDLQYLPDSVHYVKKFLAPGHSSTHSISQSGHYLYLNGANSSFGHGTVIMDLTNPEQPVVRGKWNDLYVHDCRVVNDTIWACNISDPFVTVIDATNKDSLRTITQWQNLPFPSPHNIALTPDRKYAYVTDENTHPGRLKVWDVQDLNNITLQNTWAPPGFETAIVHNVEIYDTLAVVAHYTAGVRVLNISNPTNPVEIAWYDTFPDNNVTDYDGNWAVYMFPSKLIIASDEKYGLFVLRPDLNPTPTIPVADFIGTPTTVEVGDSVKFYDVSTGVPDSWQWTATGNQTINSTAQNPIMHFTQVGQYTVKLKISNSFGTDSLVKANYINVIPAVLHPFSFTLSGIQTVLTTPTDTNKVTYKWTKSSSGSNITYKFRAQKFGGTAFRLLNSNGNGNDTSITFTKSYLDSLARDFGLNGDSLLVTCKAYAYNGFDSLSTGNSLILNIKTNTVGINLISSEIPGEFKLENNYPNPFNPETTIKYQLPKSALVMIKLYDITGREVSTLVNQQHEAGYYDFKFNASFLASGVYFYRIQAGDFTDIKRMMLVK
ncbi:MAG: choice-of-anchor B family protein [Ignavibacteriae bacterium]|nr:choice-of-anchor B family protein [Ignavibacteriota bacterium]MCB9244381.1 choice-of-anchor B family protein [Ignavibacteriales bacterium]